MIVGMNVNRVFQRSSVLEKQSRGPDRVLRIVRDYDVPNVSGKILRLIISYVDYVNRVVWKKTC